MAPAPGRSPGTATRSVRLLGSIAVVALASVGPGCADRSSERTTARSSRVRGSVTVSAASSLAKAFGQIAEDFSTRNPRVRVEFNFGPSSTLATQITRGAPADVFAAADPATMRQVVEDGLALGRATVFATNRLVIVTKPGNPHRVRSLADLADLGTVSMCGAVVPCGKYAAKSLRRAGVTIAETRISRGADAAASLAAVTTGDADAAVVYLTDLKRVGNAVSGVAIPDRDNVVATYPIAALAAGDNAAAGQAFVRAVMSAQGQATFRRLGFGPRP